MLHFVVVRQGFSIRDEDIANVFPLMGEGKLVKTSVDDLATMAVTAGIFESRTQARKAGLWGPVPHGIHLIGTENCRFWVWCPYASGAKIELLPCFSKSPGCLL